MSPRIRASEIIVGLGRPVAYFPAIARRTGVKAAVLLSQFLYWSGVGADIKGRDVSDWFYKSVDDLQSETGMRRREQELARKRLVSLNVLKERYARLEHRLYFQLSFKKIDELLAGTDADNDGDDWGDVPERTKGEMGTAPNVESGPHQTSNGHAPKPPFVKGTETTTETTAETTEPTPTPPPGVVAPEPPLDAPAREEDQDQFPEDDDGPAKQASKAEAVLVYGRWKAEWWRTTGKPYRGTAEEKQRGFRNLRFLIGRHGQDEVVACLEWAFRHGKMQFWPTMSTFMRSEVICRVQAEMAGELNGTGPSSNGVKRYGAGRTAGNFAAAQEAIRLNNERILREQMRHGQVVEEGS